MIGEVGKETPNKEMDFCYKDKKLDTITRFPPTPPLWNRVNNKTLTANLVSQSLFNFVMSSLNFSIFVSVRVILKNRCKTGLQ